MVKIEMQKNSKDVWVLRIVAATKLVLALCTLAGIIFAGFK